MTPEQKELLFKDFCARLPYEVKVQTGPRHDEDDYNKIIYDNYEVLDFIMMSIMFKDNIEEYKPCLFPMSSMTEEQNHEFLSTCNCYCGYYWTEETFDWLNAHHFDYRGLIPMGLANDATGLNIY